MEHNKRTIGLSATPALLVAPAAILDKQRSSKPATSSVRLARPGQAVVDDDDNVAVDADGHVSPDQIGIVVAHIKRLTRAASLEFALQVGAVIIYHFYDGDTNSWRARGAKTVSFRRLADHPDLPLSAGTLYRCVAIYELCDRLKAASRWPYLGASHLRLVLGLPPATQEAILSTANAKRWSVKTLQQEVSRGKSRHSAKGGRKAQSPIRKSLMAVRASLEGCRGAVSCTLLPTDEVEGALKLIEDAKASLEHFSHCLLAAARRKDATDPTVEDK